MLDCEGLQLRAALFHAIREFFRNKGFLEVDTPIRLPVVIPEASILPVTADGHYLQTSPEQCMKRLLSNGCSALFQICPCFRKGERGSRHLEEFTMLEWYRNRGNYHDVMTDCRELVMYLFKKLGKDSRFEKRISDARLSGLERKKEWSILSVEDAFSAYCPVSVQQAIEQDLFDELLVEYIEPNLGFDAPCFLVDYPVQYASLARKKAGTEGVAERFELYINGVELANGFSELTDPVEQRRRFAKEIEQMETDSGRCRRVPERFLEDLEKIDEAAGIAFGLDRLLMLLVSADTIDEVVSFSPSDWEEKGWVAH
ncbi:MAG: EF-P lysine aminoacylase GenX [Proteobacteria bacterium]|nr:MAG: EF-P lysine aminoacylase GenX [Pseudomonadota bacterium]PIE65264.1 MAG: EF-P lysine aminoacylase GenX [Desulfobacterales bacterium]